jgi:hypothetical protein
MSPFIVEMRNVYGKSMFYPRNTDSRLMADLLAVQSFSTDRMMQIKRLGVYEVTIYNPNADLIAQLEG